MQVHILCLISKDINNFNINEAAMFAIKNEPVTELPKSVNKESFFLVDLNKFELKDALADDNGAYKQYGDKEKYVEIVGESDSFEIINKGQKFLKAYSNNENIYTITKMSYKSLSNNFFVRKTIKITSLVSPKEFNRLVIGYGWVVDTPEDKKMINLKVHGNATKTDHPYRRTPLSTLNKIKRKTMEIGSSQLKFNQMIKEESIYLNNHPRNTAQFYNHRKVNLKKNDSNLRTADEYYDALHNRMKSKYNTFE